MVSFSFVSTKLNLGSSHIQFLISMFLLICTFNVEWTLIVGDVHFEVFRKHYPCYNKEHFKVISRSMRSPQFQDDRNKISVKSNLTTHNYKSYTIANSVTKMVASPKLLVVKYHKTKVILPEQFGKLLGPWRKRPRKTYVFCASRSIGFNLYLFRMQMHTNFSNTELVKIGISGRFRHVSRTGNCPTNENRSEDWIMVRPSNVALSQLVD